MTAHTALGLRHSYMPLGLFVSGGPFGEYLYMCTFQKHKSGIFLRKLNMDSCRVLLLLLLSSMRSADSTTSGFLDDVSSSDVQAVKIRLSEEKSKRLLLQNDIEALMLRLEELERKTESKSL